MAGYWQSKDSSWSGTRTHISGDALNLLSRYLILLLALTSIGCLTVPREVIQLSARTSSDIQSLHNGYRSLVRKHFTALRKIREQAFSERILRPFIEDSIKEGRLLEIVQGKVVWSSEKDIFVDPYPTKASIQKLDSLRIWNREVAEGIEKLRKESFSDLDTSESKVLDEVDRAFGNVIRGTTSLHGYLISIQKVDTAQNEILKEIGLEDLPMKINDDLDKASAQAEEWTTKVNDVEGKVGNINNRIRKM